MGALDRFLTLVALTVPLGAPILGPWLVYKHRDKIKKFVADRLFRRRALNSNQGDRR